MVTSTQCSCNLSTQKSALLFLRRGRSRGIAMNQYDCTPVANAGMQTKSAQCESQLAAGAMQACQLQYIGSLYRAGCISAPDVVLDHHHSTPSSLLYTVTSLYHLRQHHPAMVCFAEADQACIIHRVADPFHLCDVDEPGIG